MNDERVQLVSLVVNGRRACLQLRCRQLKHVAGIPASDGVGDGVEAVLAEVRVGTCQGSK